jgi:putative tricarboxylic transport membrane protein
MNDTTKKGFALPEALIGGGLLLFSAFALWQIWQIPESPIYAKVGPTTAPYITVAALAVLALFLLFEAARGGWQPDDEKEVAIDWRALVFVAAGLIANIALITWMGFTIASTVMFVLIAYGFGSRQPLRDVAIGFVVALVAYFGFAKLLGVNIGAGWFETLIGG